MTRAEVDMLRSVYERWAEGDFTASVEIFAPDIVLILRSPLPDAGSYHGLDEVADYTRGFLAPWTRIAIEAEEITEAGDRMLVAVRQHGVGKESGVATELRYFHVWTFADGRVTRLESIRERPDALAAAGLAVTDRER